MNITNGTKTKGAQEKPNQLELGLVVVTRGVQAIVEAGALSKSEIVNFLWRHSSGDWGDVCGEDRKANENALKRGSRLFSAFRSKAGAKFWVITEAVNEAGRRESTCILLPDEY